MKQFVTRSLEIMAFVFYFLIIIGSAWMGAKGGGMMNMMMMRGGRDRFDGLEGQMMGGDIDAAGLLVGAFSGFVVATIIFGTLFLLMEIRDYTKKLAEKS
ncbi:MAG TPA: hypothetical protein PLA85_00615 [Micropepsaceae bacterium]|nr:hypothetical protein [Micropepsaceae bacterium]